MVLASKFVLTIIFPEFHLISFKYLGFRDAFAAASTTNNRIAMAAVISSIYNSIKRINGEEGVHSLCSSRGLASQLLLSISPSTKNATSAGTYASSSSSPSPPTPNATDAATTNSTTTTTTAVGTATTTTAATVKSKDNSNDPVLEWLHILFFHLLQTSSNRLLQLFKTLQPRAVGESVWDFKTDSCEDNLFFEEKLSEMELNDRAVLTHEQVPQ